MARFARTFFAGFALGKPFFRILATLVLAVADRGFVERSLANCSLFRCVVQTDIKWACASTVCSRAK